MASDTEQPQYSSLLLVDDDAGQLRALTSFFEEEPFGVVACSTGTHALELLRSESIGVALVDLRLPDLSGIELLERLQAVTDRVQVIIHTAHGSYASAKDAVNLGAFAYVEKGSDASELMDVVHRAFQTRLTRYARELEDAAAERTRELTEANESLRCEVEEHKRTEAALRESEQRFRLLYEQSPLGYQSLDGRGRFIEVNEAWLKTLGYTRREVIGRSFGDFLPSEYAERFKERLRRFKAMGDVSNVQFEMVRKNGSQIAVEIDGRIGYDQEGNFLQTHCILRDVTERRQAERIVGAQRDLAMALSSATDFDEGLKLFVETALRISNMDGGGVYLLDESTAALELACSEGLSEDFIKAVARYDQDSDHVRLVMAGEPVYAKYDEVPVELSETEKREGIGALAVLPIKHEGRVIGCLNVASRASSEVSAFARTALEVIAAQMGSSLARLKTEEGAKELARAAIEMVRLSPAEDIVSFICDKVGELAGDAIVSVSSIDEERRTLRIRKMIGVEPDALNVIDELLEHRLSEGAFDGVHEEAARQLASGKLRKLDGGLSDLFFGRVGKSLCDAIGQTIGARDAYSIGLVSMGKLLGSVIILPTAGVRLNGNAIEAFVNAASMALERGQAQEQLRQRDAELAHMARLHTTGEMATGLAHEISQPLYAIVNYAEGTSRRLRSAPTQPDDLTDVIEKIARQARRASDVINRLRGFTKKREPYRSTTDLNQLVKDLLKLLEHELRQSGAAVELELAGQLPAVLVDRVQIEQVLVNLIRNALDAMCDVPSKRRRLTLTTSFADDQAVEI